MNSGMSSKTTIIVSSGKDAHATLDELTEPILVLAQPGQASTSCTIQLTGSLPGTKHNSSTLNNQVTDDKLIESLPEIPNRDLMEFLLSCGQDATPRLEYLVKHVEDELRNRSCQDELMTETFDAACQQERDDTSSKLLEAQIAAIMNPSSSSSSSTRPQEKRRAPSRVLKEIPSSVHEELGENFCLYTIVKRCADNSSHSLTEEALAGFLAISSARTRYYLKHLSQLEIIEETRKAGTKTYQIHSSVKQEWIDSLVPRFECATLDQFRSRYLNPDRPRGAAEVLRALHERLKAGDDWVAANELMGICSITRKQLSCRCTPLVHERLIERSGRYEDIRRYRLSEKIKGWLRDTPNLLELRS